MTLGANMKKQLSPSQPRVRSTTIADVEPEMTVDSLKTLISIQEGTLVFYSFKLFYVHRSGLAGKNRGL